MNKIKLLVLFFISLIAFACSQDKSTQPQETFFDIQGENGFVGTVNGTNAFIALLVANEEAVVYVCNGEEEISEWFNGNITDPENINLTNSSGARVVGNFVGRSFTGSVVLSDASTHSFTATVNNGTETGIFRVHGDLATQEGIVAGWILNAESAERGSFRFNSVFQATPTKPKTGNTFFFNNNTFPIQRFAIYHPDSLSFIR